MRQQQRNCSDMHSRSADCLQLHAAQTCTSAQQTACIRQQMRNCSTESLRMPLIKGESHAGGGMHGDWRTRLRLLQLSICLLGMLLLSRGHHAGLDHDQLHDCLLMNRTSSQQLQTHGAMPAALEEAEQDRML